MYHAVELNVILDYATKSPLQVHFDPELLDRLLHRRAGRELYKQAGCVATPGKAATLCSCNESVGRLILYAGILAASIRQEQTLRSYTRAVKSSQTVKHPHLYKLRHEIPSGSCSPASSSNLSLPHYLRSNRRLISHSRHPRLPGFPGGLLQL